MFWKIRLLIENLINKSLFFIGSYTAGLPQMLLQRFNLKLPSREHLVLLALSSNFRGQGVEIGVYQGDFSKKILEYTKLAKLYCVDPWREFDYLEYVDMANDNQLVQDQRYEVTRKKLELFTTRSEIIRDISEAARVRFDNESLDFIYIDANHSYEGCLQDLQMWWPKLKVGGLMAGDDYTNTDNGVTKYGVKLAVDQFFQNHKLHTTYKSGKVHWPNWYVFKK